MRVLPGLAFLGGVAAGVCVGILVAPEKGARTRHLIVDFLELKGIILGKDKLEEIIHKVKAHLRCGYSKSELHAIIERVIAEEHLR